MAIISAIASLLSLVGKAFSALMGLVLFRSGEKAQAAADSAKAAQATKAELDASAQAPTTRGDLDKRFDDGTF